MLSMYVANSIIFILVHLWESMLFVYIEMILMEEFHTKMKKLLSILLAVAIVFTMTVSVSASKRLDINGEIVIGTLVWSGTPYEFETLTATTKMRVSDPAYGLRARLYGRYRFNNGGQTVAIEYYQPLDTGIQYNLPYPEVSRSYTVTNGCWLEGDADYDAYYRGDHTYEHEHRSWNV